MIDRSIHHPSDRCIPFADFVFHPVIVIEITLLEEVDDVIFQIDIARIEMVRRRVDIAATLRLHGYLISGL
jgi:hypothetical protein